MRGGEGEVGQHPAHPQQRPGVGGRAGGRVQIVDTAGVEVTLIHVSTEDGWLWIRLCCDKLRFIDKTDNVKSLSQNLLRNVHHFIFFLQK